MSTIKENIELICLSIVLIERRIDPGVLDWIQINNSETLQYKMSDRNLFKNDSILWNDSRPFVFSEKHVQL